VGECLIDASCPPSARLLLDNGGPAIPSNVPRKRLVSELRPTSSRDGGASRLT
jgi:hypothetical protein